MYAGESEGEEQYKCKPVSLEALLAKATYEGIRELEILAMSRCKNRQGNIEAIRIKKDE